jgi:hypothetical protein
MTSWKKNLLTRLFRRNESRRITPSTSLNRFRPSILALEDRTVPSGSDMFANATVLTGTFASDVSDNTGATGEFGEENLPHANGEINSLWWKWTAPGDGHYEVNTFGSFVDTVLGVYTGSSLGNLQTVGSDDDDNDPTTGSVQSRVDFDAVGGTTYYFAVDGFGSPDYVLSTGEIDLNLGGVPLNDNFANATSAGGTVFGSNVLATSEPGEPSEPVKGDVNSVWWSWTASSSGPVSISTTGSSFDTVLSIYTGNSVSTLTLATDAHGNPAINDDANDTLQSQIDLNAVAGTTYYIAVDGTQYFTGSIQLNLPPAPPPPENSPPVVNNQSFSVDENSPGGTAVGTVVATDADNDTLSYSITGGTGASLFNIDSNTGAITVANSASLDYETTPSFNLTVQVSDSGSPSLSVTTSVSVSLLNVNDAPVLDNSGSPALTSINQGTTNSTGTLVSTLIGNSISDQDAGAVKGIAIVATNSTNGTWQYSTNGGSTWTNVGAVSNGSARLLAADANTRVRFVPNAGFSGTVTNGITYRAWDQTSGVNGGLGDTSVNGGLSAFSTATETASISVLTLSQQFSALSTDVQNLVNGGFLTASQASTLQSKLDTAQKKLAAGNTNAAINNLNAFINQVNTYVSGGFLSPAQGQSLKDEANALVSGI